MMTAEESQLAGSVLMIRPLRFESNPQTAESNRFQSEVEASPDALQATALAEFDALVVALRSAGIDVHVFEDTPEPHTPDSVFPNNWISFHADGRVALYPMEAVNRRKERRLDIVERLSEEFQVSELVDLSAHETHGHFLEGTGSMVFDRVHRIAYACLSSRTHLDVLGDFAQRFDYEIVAFEAVDRHGVPIYHTNVLMALGESLAVICDEAIVRDEQRAAVLDSLTSTGHEVLSINYTQLEAFAGNMLELKNRNGTNVFAMSKRAWDSLDAAQQLRLTAHGGIVAVPIDNIERAAGGSVRCMLAEIHLPRATI